LNTDNWTEAFFFLLILRGEINIFKFGIVLHLLQGIIVIYTE